IVVYTCISFFVAFESWKSLANDPKKKRVSGALSAAGKDHQFFSRFAKRVQKLPLGPRVSLPFSGIPSISVGAILLVSFVGGAFSSFLGGGAGYIRMPSMVYFLGIPTHIAVGTDLFEIVVSASVGSFEHAVNGNVDILVALIMQTGAAVGAQIGATLTQYFSGPRIRLAFAPLPLLGAGLIVYGLLTGHHAK
ncbi:MAG TPA: sulfite exporter TauE/SafE family protein, partial [Candidatus Methylacidiphilales bacterium]